MVAWIGDYCGPWVIWRLSDNNVLDTIRNREWLDVQLATITTLVPDVKELILRLGKYKSFCA